ncbi:hypothetical protein DID75_00895 [Candidatus Marinamargulisbacteria bacterium SCGC AG-410-N11]|nr:hypothetical protein DID75_00895 [Candidatus Marinamargulisbacteria bacterium SCGC AG-410-N11]
MPKKFEINKKKPALFSLDRKLNRAEDFNAFKVDQFGSDVQIDILLSDVVIRKQVRREIDNESVDRLANSIKDQGLIYPIIVMKIPDSSDKYTLLIGEHRYHAVKKLGRKKITARIIPFIKAKSDRELMQLAENLERRNLNTIEIADTIMSIRVSAGMTLEQVASKVGRSLNTIKQYSRISKLTEEEKSSLVNQGASFDRIIQYLKSKNKKSVVTTPILNKIYKISNTKYSLSRLSFDLKKHSKKEIEDKLEQAESFIKKAREHLGVGI